MVPPPPRLQGAADRIPRPPDPLSAAALPILLADLIPLGKTAAGLQGRGFDVDEEVAAALDEHWDGDGPQPAIGLEGFEFVELEGSDKAAAQGLVPGKESLVQLLAMAAESLESPFECGPPDTKKLRTSSKADLGAEQTRDRRVEPRSAQTVVNAKGLRAEAAAAIETAKTRHSSSVATTMLVAMATPALRAGFDAARTRLVRATRRAELHRGTQPAIWSAVTSGRRL